ncbi:hypothetical protein FKM82_017357 [Ascaphus truei]
MSYNYLHFFTDDDKCAQDTFSISPFPLPMLSAITSWLTGFSDNLLMDKTLMTVSVNKIKKMTHQSDNESTYWAQKHIIMQSITEQYNC